MDVFFARVDPDGRVAFARLAGGPYRFVNVSRALPADLVARAPAAEWVEDADGRLRDLFRVAGSPTLFVAGADGKITQIIPGVSEGLRDVLLAGLGNPPGPAGGRD